MVARTDLRPTRADDSLKKLLGKVANPQTVPHGVKVAQPGEYVDFYATDGVVHRWDGDTIAEYDARIAEGAAAVTAAQESLAETESTLAAAGARITQVEQDTTPTAIGDVAAAQINERRLIIGRDAILTGTVDVAQLNVTGAMSAKIVSAMSVESKKLVVTEDAILNRATVVQSLVTPELIADKINVNNLGARLVTSGAIQTDPAANRGVKITNAGVNAWDANGVQTIRLNGSDNLLMGQLATGDSTVGRIRVFNAMHPVNRRPSGFITIQDAGGITASQGVIEYNASQLQLSIKDGTEQGYSQPFRKGIIVTRDGLVLAGNLSVNGQFSKGGAIAAYSISAGTIPAGSYVSFSQPVTLSNGQRPWPVIQPSSSNFAKLDAAAWIPNNNVEGRIYNNSNFAATNVWIDILTFGIER